MASIERTYFVAALLLCQLFFSECLPLQNNSHSNVGDVAGKGNGVPGNNPHVVPKIKNKEGSSFKLRDDPKCKEDIADFCSKEAKTGGNFDLLLCLQNQIKEDDLSEECHQTLWNYKNILVHDPKFEGPAISLCKEDLKNIKECSRFQPGTGDVVPCLVENKDGIKNTRCKHVVNKLAQIMFSDYRLLKDFYQDCKEDVAKFECGMQDAMEKGDLHTQGSTLECLGEQEANLTKKCRLRVIRATELQGDDYHLNRALYYACRNDRERLCEHVQSGDGRVYDCLMKRKFDPKMSEECRDKLTVKQQVEAKDYKANYPFLESCEKDIKKHKCSPSGESATELAKVLLCLEAAINDGKQVSGKCQGHMKDLQEELMEDYSINPNVVANCEMEINKYCGKVKKGGKTLDCLMEKAMEKEEPNSNVEFTKGCYDAVSNLLKETGAGGDFKVDATLRETCRLPAMKLCQNTKNDMSTLSCLMENIDNRNMGVDCQEQLMHLQFFLARDFELDEALYRACNKDAEKVCETKDYGDPDKSNTPQGMTLACLYRHIVLEHKQREISKPCAAQVMRTMHQRAADVKLMPQIQTSCMQDLAKYCTNKVEKGEEIKCLQDHYDDLRSNCKKSIEEFTEEEGEDMDLDKALIKHCTEMVKEFCEDVLENSDAEGVLPCLFKHKYDSKMDVKCRAELNHRELIELKDYRFSAKFKQACKDDVIKNCQEAKTKPDVIECLSGKVRNAVIGEKDHTISESCRSQLKVEKLRQAEDIHFDPKLFGACSFDADKLCEGIDVNNEGPGAVLECLKAKEDELSLKCKKQLFEREKAEAVNNQLDVRLFRVCKAMIKKFCMEVPPEKVLGCLRKHKRDIETDEKCRDMVFTRQKISLKDIELNPDLKKACKKDIPKFCHDVTGNDQVIPCLKTKIGELSEDCEAYIVELEEEAALDYRLNEALAKACKEEIEQFCSDLEPGRGDVMECLKENFKQIKDQKCKKEVKEALVEERTDIMADPLLHDACSATVKKYCDDVHHGRGRILQCLLQVLEDKKIHQKECRNILKARKEMWNTLQIAGPETLVDLASVVSNSPRRNYFFIVFSCVLAIIFIGGLISGRLSKRVAREVKNR